MQSSKFSWVHCRQYYPTVGWCWTSTTLRALHFKISWLIRVCWWSKWNVLGRFLPAEFCAVDRTSRWKINMHESFFCFSPHTLMVHHSDVSPYKQGILSVASLRDDIHLSHMVLKLVLSVPPRMHVEALGKSSIKWESWTSDAETYWYYSHWISSMKANCHGTFITRTSFAAAL